MTPAEQARDFRLAPPEVFGTPVTLWATWYWTPSYASQPGVPLLDARERPLGPSLPAEEFCHAAVQGAVRVDGRVYTFATTGRTKACGCSLWRPDMPQAPYVRFQPSASPFGEGVGGFSLVPYRTIATDESVLPTGTVLYIPAARGCAITLPDGRRIRHDGYFFAGDDGYGIDGHHIDVFNGISDVNPFPWVASRKDRPFAAYLVTDGRIIAALAKAAHPVIR